MASAVTKSNRALRVCGGKGALHHSCAANKSAAPPAHDAIMSIWAKMSEKSFQDLVESTPQVIKVVLKANGSPTFQKQGVPYKVDSQCTSLQVASPSRGRNSFECHKT